MGNTLFHINKAERNEQFYQAHGLDRPQFSEWAIVVLFYVSMHYVDAVLYQDTSLTPNMRNPQDHKVRNTAVSQCSELAPIAPMYINLRDRWEARYHKISFPANYLANFKSRIFEPTKAYLRRTLGLP